MQGAHICLSQGQWSASVRSALGKANVWAHWTACIPAVSWQRESNAAEWYHLPALLRLLLQSTQQHCGVHRDGKSKGVHDMAVCVMHLSLSGLGKLAYVCVNLSIETYSERYTLCPRLPVSLCRSDHSLLVSACRAHRLSAPLLATSLQRTNS